MNNIKLHMYLHNIWFFYCLVYIYNTPSAIVDHYIIKWTFVFKPIAPGFLELLLSVNVCMRVCVCVSAPEAMNN